MFKKLNKAFLFIAFALSLIKAQDVSIAVGDTAFAGYTDDIVVPITVSNPNGNVGGVQFDVSASPAMVMLSGVSTIGVAAEFSADYNMLSDGTSRVVFYNAGDPNGLNAGTSSRVINLHFGGSDVLSAVLEIKLNNVVASDASGNLLTSVSIAGDLTIGDVIYLSGSTATADVEETVEIDFSVINTGSIGGVQFDIKDTIQSYIPAGPNQVEFQPNIDGTGGLVERIMLRKNLDRKRALQFLTTSVATQIRNGDLLPTDGVNFKDVLRFTSKQQQGKQVAFNELQIGNNDQFIDTAISDIDRAIDSVQQDPNTKVKKASDRFYETKVLPLLQEYGSFDDIPPERYADLETDWANDPILRFTEFPEYIKGGYSKTQTGTRFSNSSYSNRIGKANFLDNVKEEMKNSFSKLILRVFLKKKIWK